MTKIKSGMIRDSWNDSTLNTNELNSELGFGHGYHNRVVQRRRSLVSATDAENDDSIDWYYCCCCYYCHHVIFIGTRMILLRVIAHDLIVVVTMGNSVWWI